MLNNNKSIKNRDCRDLTAPVGRYISVSALEKVYQQTERASGKSQQQPQYAARLTAWVKANKAQSYCLKGKGKHYVCG